MRLKYKAVRSTYWLPGEDYVARMLDSLAQRLRDGDVIVVSEKAVTTAAGNIVNEAKAKPGLLASILTRIWMRMVWGFFLGPLCRFRPETLRRLRKYPIPEGCRHKQVVLDHAGFLQALNYGSEGGIDISNLPYAYACLPLVQPEEDAQTMLDRLSRATGKTVTLIIADTDSTFSIGGLHFTARPHPIRGIRSLKGPLPFIVGRALRLRQRATPVAVAGSRLSVDEALRYSEIAHHARGSGAGRTVWDGAEKFGVGFSEISWEMLKNMSHYPIVLIRRVPPRRKRA